MPRGYARRVAVGRPKSFLEDYERNRRNLAKPPLPPEAQAGSGLILSIERHGASAGRLSAGNAA
jgi:hypothetical protein